MNRSFDPASALPDAASGTPFGPRIHARAIYLKTFQALSYQRLQGLFRDVFGLRVSEGALMNMFARRYSVFQAEADKAVRNCARPMSSPLTRPAYTLRRRMPIIGYSATREALSR